MTAEQNRWLRSRSVNPADYDAAYERRAAAGENVHGEADLIASFHPASVLDEKTTTSPVSISTRTCSP